jgi:hypothetical protein
VFAWKPFAIPIFAAVSLGSCAAVSHVMDPGRIPSGAPTPRPQGAEWIDLLDAAHAAQWKDVTDDTKIFSIENGEMHIPGGSKMRHACYMGEQFGDFELHLEFKMAKKNCNSGVFVRSASDDPVYKGMEIQVLQDYGTAPNKNGCGALYDVASPMFNMVRPAGEWNSYDIACKGSMLSVVANGFKVLDLDLAKLTMPVGKFDTPLASLPRSGYILVQDHGGAVTYRNVLVKKLQP